METIHIAYAFDDNYTELACVSMASILYNTKYNVHFHVLENKLSDDNKSILESLGKSFSHGVWSFHNIGNFDTSAFVTSLHFTVETYFRLLLPDLLPEIDRIIYLDGDTVIDGDIGELWQMELNNTFFAAAPEIDQLQFRKKKKSLGIDENEVYFNAGMLLLDLKKLREFCLLEKSLEALPRLRKKTTEDKLIWYVDQDVLNHLFTKKFTVAKPKFNFQDYVFHALTSYAIPLREWKIAYGNPVIIHYVSPVKPNVISRQFMQSRMWEKYYTYKTMTPYADVDADVLRVNRYRSMEKQTNNSLFLPYLQKQYLIFKRQSLFMELAEKLPKMLQGKKLALWGASKFVGDLVVTFSMSGVYVDLLVDGMKVQHDSKVFDLFIHDPRVLHNKNDEYFVLLTMQSMDVAEKLGRELRDYGFGDDEFHHVFAPLWNDMHNPL